MLFEVAAALARKRTMSVPGVAPGSGTWVASVSSSWNEV